MLSLAMALIVSLDRGAVKQDLGDFQEVVLVDNEVRLVGNDSVVIAKHMHNRWIAPGDGGDAYITLNIAGPLIVQAGGKEPKLGPYMSFSMTDGILYVEQRVLGLWDSQNSDWYVKDACAHTKRVHVSFRPND